MRILLAEDDELIGSAIQQALQDAALAVDWVRDGASVVAAAGVDTYDAVLLDLGLPKLDGLDVLHALRGADNPVPVIIITARDAVESRIDGLDRGADDYIVKPFSVDELEARIRAVVRRHHGVSNAQLGNSDLTLDPATRELSRNGHAQLLSAREFALMQALLLRPGAILSRDELEDRIYGWNEEVASNAVEVIIHGLRRKFGKDAILNVRGLGWRVGK